VGVDVPEAGQDRGSRERVGDRAMSEAFTVAVDGLGSYANDDSPPQDGPEIGDVAVEITETRLGLAPARSARASGPIGRRGTDGTHKRPRRRAAAPAASGAHLWDTGSE